jgi:hypothetical protein
MPMLADFRSMERNWDPANSMASDRNRGCTRIYPSCLSDLVLLVYVELLQWSADVIWRRWKEMAWLAYAS